MTFVTLFLSLAATAKASAGSVADPVPLLNGTEKADSFKWLLTLRMGTKQRIYGYHGPRMAELAQSLHHWRHGRYLAYAHPKVLRRGRSMLALGVNTVVLAPV